MHARAVEARRAAREHLHEARLVERRIGIGRARERGDAARDRGAHLRFERRLVFETRLAQTGREVDEPRAGREPLRIDGLVGLESGGRLVERGDVPIDDEDRSRLVASRCGIDHPRSRDFDPHVQPSIDITAILTAIPKVTFGRITL